MYLLLQAYVPLESSLFERIIYIWGCNKGRCCIEGKGIRVVRAVKTDPAYISKLNSKKTKTNDYSVANL